MLWALRRTVLASPDSDKPAKPPPYPKSSARKRRTGRDPDA